MCSWRLEFLWGVVVCGLVAAAAAPPPPRERPDLLVSGFEGSTYGDWITTGEAFGAGPARGTLPNQQAVSGFRGAGLANSYLGGDGATGTLRSPAFRIERHYLNLLVGGGRHPGETCVNLLVEDEVVRTETGLDNELLTWRTWDLRGLGGKLARIEIVDRHTGGWGHINVDEIVQSDRRAAPPLHQSRLYRETYRPQFHFTAKAGWLNDPNGLVYYDGEYHLFFQHNPRGNEWGNMTWGHAVSTDLVHWKQLPNAVEPDTMGTIFSGSAVVDWKNTTGFGKPGAPPLVAIYTSAGGTSPESRGAKFTQSIAYSSDRGRTWTKYSGNPVLPHIVAENRDPKVVWHEGTRRWIMALYLQGEEFALFASPNLKSWKELQRITLPGCSECPDFFEIAVEDELGRRAGSRWVFTAANGKYLVGIFDGERYVPETGVQTVEHGPNSYAAQTFSDLPDGRRIQLAWMRGGSYPGMPFNQQMSVPCELKLRQTRDGLRLLKFPSSEVEALRRQTLATTEGEDVSGETVFGNVARQGQADIEAAFALGPGMACGLEVAGQMIRYDKRSRKLHAGGLEVPLEIEGDELRLRVLVDRTSIELFANGGRAAVSWCFVLEDEPKGFRIFGEGGVRRLKAKIWRMDAIW